MPANRGLCVMRHPISHDSGALIAGMSGRVRLRRHPYIVDRYQELVPSDSLLTKPALCPAGPKPQAFVLMAPTLMPWISFVAREALQRGRRVLSVPGRCALSGKPYRFLDKRDGGPTARSTRFHLSKPLRRWYECCDIFFSFLPL